MILCLKEKLVIPPDEECQCQLSKEFIIEYVEKKGQDYWTKGVLQEEMKHFEATDQLCKFI